MKKIYEYLYYRLYYRIYTWNLKTWGAKDVPEWNASFGIAFLMMLNIFVVYIIFDIFSEEPIFNETPKLLLMGIMLVFMITTYFWFVHKKRYLKIVKKYKDETKKQRLTRGLLVFLYVVFSIGIIMLLAYIKKHCIM
ncbi:MAG: hypothetical protein GXO80_03755 [Chlorobi bacterium]|nr:hypothetical protein [Chlorobiota bacterium]